MCRQRMQCTSARRHSTVAVQQHQSVDVSFKQPWIMLGFMGSSAQPAVSVGDCSLEVVATSSLVNLPSPGDSRCRDTSSASGMCQMYICCAKD